jgi:hypothetical protein
MYSADNVEDVLVNVAEAFDTNWKKKKRQQKKHTFVLTTCATDSYGSSVHTLGVKDIAALCSCAYLTLDGTDAHEVGCYERGVAASGDMHTARRTLVCFWNRRLLDSGSRTEAHTTLPSRLADIQHRAPSSDLAPHIR